MQARLRLVEVTFGERLGRLGEQDVLQSQILTGPGVLGAGAIGTGAGTPFIQASERPAVGESIVQAADERSAQA